MEKLAPGSRASLIHWLWYEVSIAAEHPMHSDPFLPLPPIPSQISTVFLLSKWMLSNSSVFWLGASFAFQFKAKSLFAIIALCYIWQPPALNCQHNCPNISPRFHCFRQRWLLCNHNESNAGFIYEPCLSVKGNKCGLSVMRISCRTESRSPEMVVPFDSFLGAAENVCLEIYFL